MQIIFINTGQTYSNRVKKLITMFKMSCLMRWNVKVLFLSTKPLTLDRKGTYLNYEENNF